MLHGQKGIKAKRDIFVPLSIGCHPGLGRQSGRGGPDFRGRPEAQMLVRPMPGKSLDRWGDATKLIEDDVPLGHIEDVGVEGLDMALKVETDKWASHHVEIGPKGLEMLFKKRGVAFHLASLEPNPILPCVLEAPPAPCALVYHAMHWMPFWRADWRGPHTSRPWLPEASVAGFAAPFKESVEQLQCHCDVSCRAASHCAFHSVVVLEHVLAGEEVLFSKKEAVLALQWIRNEDWGFVS